MIQRVVSGTIAALLMLAAGLVTGTAWAAEIVLYDGQNFGGQSVTQQAEKRPAPGSLTQACTGPYRILLGQSCKWTCGPNSSPDEARNQCSRNSGYVGRGTDRRGRVRCVASSGLIEVQL